MDNNRESIKVICRLRPENQKEIDIGMKSCVSLLNEKSIRISDDECKKDCDNQEFAYDKIFGSDSQQEDVFNFAAIPIINGALSGYNGTVFCYGQTSSGKTFTMEGVHDNKELRGIIPRMMEYIFESISKFPSNLEFSIKCSFVEVYLEKIQDLLDCKLYNKIK